MFLQLIHFRTTILCAPAGRHSSISISFGRIIQRFRHSSACVVIKLVADKLTQSDLWQSIIDLMNCSEDACKPFKSAFQRRHKSRLCIHCTVTLLRHLVLCIGRQQPCSCFEFFRMIVMSRCSSIFHVPPLANTSH